MAEFLADIKVFEQNVAKGDLTSGTQRGQKHHFGA